MKITASLQNKQRMLSRMQTAINSKLTAVEKAVQLAGIEAQSEAKKRARVDTGRMRSSIMQKLIRESRYRIIAQVDTNVKYARFIEYGTKYSRAYPFLRPAFKIAAAKFRERMKKLK